MLRRSMNLDAFVDLGERMNETLGAFLRITDVLEVKRGSSRAGKVGQVIVELEFDRGLTTGTFSFHRVKKEWKLVGIDVVIPEPKREQASKLEYEFDRIRAPDEVLFALTEILEDLREGKVEQVWERSAEPFRESSSLDRFVAINRDLDDKLGKFERVLMVISSGLHPNKEIAKVNVLLEYEKMRTNGLFTFRKVADDWQLSFYKPLVPEPVLPAREPNASGEPFVPPRHRRRPRGDRRGTTTAATPTRAGPTASVKTRYSSAEVRV